MQKTGDDYFDSKEFQELLSSYERSEQTGCSMFLEPDEMTDLADYYQLTGNQIKASEIIDYALEVYPGDALPLVFKARQSINEGKFEEAKQYVEMIIDKEDPEYIYLSAELMIVSGNADEADEYLANYCDTQEGNDREDVVIDCARIFIDYDDYATAQKWLTRATDTEHDDYKELQARIHFANGKYDDCIGIFKELVDRDPFSKKNWQALASAQFMNENYSAALESSEYAIAINPYDADSLMAKANAMFRLEKFEEALEYYQRYSEQVPTDDYGYLSQGIALVCLDRLEEAIDILNKALETGGSTSPNKAHIYQEMAFAYGGMEQFDKAVEVIEKTRELDCDHVEMEVIRGHILLMSGSFDSAERVFKQAIRDSEDASKTLLRIIVSLQENDYAEAAYNLFKMLQAVCGDELTCGFSYMALCCNDLKRTDEFLHYLKIACECNPKEVQRVLGRYFPTDIQPADYYKFASGILSSKQ